MKQPILFQFDKCLNITYLVKILTSVLCRMRLWHSQCLFETRTISSCSELPSFWLLYPINTQSLGPEAKPVRLTRELSDYVRKQLSSQERLTYSRQSSIKWWRALTNEPWFLRFLINFIFTHICAPSRGCVSWPHHSLSEHSSQEWMW